MDLRMGLNELSPSEGHLERAFELSEAARAHSFLDSLLGERASKEIGADGSPKAQRLDLKKELDAIDADAKRKSADDDTYRHRVSEILERIDRLSTTATSSQQLRSDELSIESIRNSLSPDCAILEYLLGEESAYLWIITREGIQAFRLGESRILESLTREFRARLTERSVRVAGEHPTFRRQRIARADRGLADVGEKLSKYLFPMADVLGRKKKLFVVPDGALHYLPLAALPVPGEKGTLWVEKATISYLPTAQLILSGSTLSESRSARGAIALLGDPVFSQADPRLSKGEEAKSESLSDGVDVLRGTGLSRLPFSGAEVEAIAQLIPEDAPLVATGLQASKSLALSALASYRVVHFATHGIVDSEHPELSSVVLSLISNSGSEIDGFLRLYDVVDLNAEAELVVLSGCSTALGKQVRGEGVIGLSRGFLQSGVQTVVSSLWDVSDRSTSTLMVALYRSILRDGLSAPEALRAAQLSFLRSSEEIRHPYYWAAFLPQELSPSPH